MNYYEVTIWKNGSVYDSKTLCEDCMLLAKEDKEDETEVVCSKLLSSEFHECEDCGK